MTLFSVIFCFAVIPGTFSGARVDFFFCDVVWFTVGCDRTFFVSRFGLVSTCLSRGHSTSNFGGTKQYKSMVILKDLYKITMHCLGW